MKPGSRTSVSSRNGHAEAQASAGDPCGILARLRCRDFKVAGVEVHHHAERRHVFGAADQLRVALQSGTEFGVVEAGHYVSRQITERRARLGIEHDDRVGVVGAVRLGRSSARNVRAGEIRSRTESSAAWWLDSLATGCIPSRAVLFLAGRAVLLAGRS